MLAQFVERLTRRTCARCGGHMQTDEVGRFHIALVCVVCGDRMYMLDPLETWN